MQEISLSFPWSVVVFAIIANLVITAAYVYPFWEICKKAGFNSAMSLTIFIPVVNVGTLCFLAFRNWKGPNAPDSQSFRPRA